MNTRDKGLAVLRKLLLGGGSERPQARRSFGLADPVNLVLLLAAMAFYWGLSDRAVDGTAEGRTLASLPYFLGQGVFFWYLVSRVVALVPLGPRGSRLLYSSSFALLYLALVVNYQCFALMQVHIDPSLVFLVAEPGFLADLTFETWQLLLVLAGLSVLFGIQLLLSSLSFGPYLGKGLRVNMHGFAAQSLCLACILGAWTFWSYNNHVNHAEANEQVEATPLFPPRSVDLGLPRLWAALGVEPDYAPIETQQIVRQHEQLLETRLFRDFHRNRKLPSDLGARQDWNILVLGAESWRWDMFTPEIMPRLWAISQRRGWVSPAHYSTGNSTAEGLYGLFSGQTPLYWLTSYKYRLSPVFFEILKRLGYRTNVLSSSNLSYRAIDEYVFGRNIDSRVVLKRPPQRELEGLDEADAAALRQAAKGDGKELWDLAVAERYLTALDERGDGKHFDFLFFYATHYRYHYPEAFERFKPVTNADFALFNLYLKVMAPRLLNRYRNAAHYLDFLFSSILEKLERRGDLDRTIVVITGDHGEEFFEEGRFGHSMALNDYQTRVPLLLFLPNQAPITYSVTSHADVVPTILSALGTDPALQRHFTGKNLLNYDPGRNAALVMSLMHVGAPMEFALVREHHKTHFVNRSDLLTVRSVSNRSQDPGPDKANTDEDLRYVLALKNHFAPEGAAGPRGRQAARVREEGEGPASGDGPGDRSWRRGPQP